MAINKNHEFEELNGIKCSVVEKNATAKRVNFLKIILEHNGYLVIVIPTITKPEKLNDEEIAKNKEQENTFTIGVTDYSFNTINALYGRLLRTNDNKILTPAYWYQKTTLNQEELPYYTEK